MAYALNGSLTMARRPRLQFPGAIYHVMSRGNRKFPIYDDDDDRRVFMTTIAQAVRRYGVRVFAWCLMPNHYHLVLETPRANLSDAMRHINGVYTQSSNRLHQRTGHVFEGRFRSIIVQRESYLRRVARYVVLNPVRAHLAIDVGDWRWSSYRATAALEPAPDYLCLDWLSLAFPDAPPGGVREQYVQFVNSPAARKATLGVSRSVIGSPSFERRVRDLISAKQPDRLLPYSHRSIGRPTLDVLFAGAVSRQARDRRIWQAHVEYGYRLSEIACVLGIHPSTASVILRRMDRAMPNRFRGTVREDGINAT